MNKEELQAAVDAIPYWYHRIELPHGITTPGWAPIDASAYRMPERMDGEQVLDIGAWDGYWSFEAVKRGAKKVVAIDDFSDTCGDHVNAKRSRKGFDLCNALVGGKKVRLLQESVYDLPQNCNAIYDRMFAFGLLYHLKHPTYALEQMHSRLAEGGQLHIETAILDDCQSAYSNKVYSSELCCAEFYPGKEFARNASNWWLPTMKCVEAWLTSTGFEVLDRWRLTDNPQSLAEHRGFFVAKAI